jgi:urease accessory protein
VTPSVGVLDIVPEQRTVFAAAGHGELRIVRSGGRSMADRVYATSPLRLLTPANHGDAAWIYQSSYGGGFVDGDRVVVDVEVCSGAAAFLSTQASTKIYRSPRGTASELSGRVAAGALLVVAPDPVVCFAAARYRQAQQYDVADGGSLVVVDWLTSGRHRAGERWAFAEYEARLVVRHRGREIVHDVVALRARDGDLRERLGRFNVLALVTIIGGALQAESAAAVATAGVDAVTPRAGQLMAATVLGDAGCVVRIAGTSLERVSRTIRDLLAFLPGRLGDSPWDRKW